jgi:hypothetical protein
MKKYLPLILISTLALTSCVERGAADERLARGCAAGIELFLIDGNKIKEVKTKAFGEAAEGRGYRLVTLGYVESDGWADVDKTGVCIFAEEFGVFNMTHNASIYQVKVNDQTYGKEGNEILGSYDEILKLTETVERAMGGF